MNETLVLKPHPNNPKARVRFLRGQDDGHDYEVRVPLRCKTVEDALDWLRPDEVPADAPRQGEFYFVGSSGPHKAAGCSHYGEPSPSDPYYTYCGSTEHTSAGSSYKYTVDSFASFSRRHRATECWSVVKSGEVCFVGRRRVKTHSFVSRPRYFVRGTVYHPEHGNLDLGSGWFEVIPNGAHGPFPVRGLGPED